MRNKNIFEALSNDKKIRQNNSKSKKGSFKTIKSKRRSKKNKKNGTNSRNKFNTNKSEKSGNFISRGNYETQSKVNQNSGKSLYSRNRSNNLNKDWDQDRNYGNFKERLRYRNKINSENQSLYEEKTQKTFVFDEKSFPSLSGKKNKRKKSNKRKANKKNNQKDENQETSNKTHTCCFNYIDALKKNLNNAKCEISYNTKEALKDEFRKMNPEEKETMKQYNQLKNKINIKETLDEKNKDKKDIDDLFYQWKLDKIEKSGFIKKYDCMSDDFSHDESDKNNINPNEWDDNEDDDWY